MNTRQIKELSNERLASMIISGEKAIGRRFQPASRSRNQVLWNEWQRRLLNGDVNCHPEDLVKNTQNN